MNRAGGNCRHLRRQILRRQCSRAEHPVLFSRIGITSNVIGAREAAGLRCACGLAGSHIFAMEMIE
jgi:hypothetical protein